MLKITFACFHCQNPMTVEAEHGGKRGRCPKCGSEFAIPCLEGDATGMQPPPPSPPPEILAETSRLKKALVEAGARTAAAERTAAERESEARRQVAEREREIERLKKDIEALRRAPPCPLPPSPSSDAGAVARLEEDLARAKRDLADTRRELDLARRDVADLRARAAAVPAGTVRPAASIFAPRAAGPGGALSDQEAVAKLGDAYRELKSQITKVIVGQEEVIDQLLISIFSRGHCLLIGVPGLAKTMLIATLARTLSLSYSRIQFTPDLMPSDITGTEVIQEDKASGERRFKFLPGPIFANVVLADEINRTPPKTQAALLEAMQEHQVTAGGKKHLLPEPFFVLATQNPIEQEGTYPLPEAQLDRFMFNVLVDYPSEEEEVEIMRLTTADVEVELRTILTGEEILRLQEIVRRVPVSDDVVRYALRFTRSTRVTKPGVPDFVKEWVSWGAGPRASQYLILGAKARAVLLGRYHVLAEDVRAVLGPVLRHRILTNFSAEAEGITPDKIIERMVETVGAEPAMAT